VIPALKRALTRLGDAPADAGDAAERLAARAAIHSCLAALDSRVALHDLREIIVLRPPGLMAGLLESAARIGDASLVPALARAATEDPDLGGSCRDAYRAIAAREKLHRRSAALRKVRAGHRAALDAFLAAPRPRR
jgi:glutathione S-transferase